MDTGNSNTESSKSPVSVLSKGDIESLFMTHMKDDSLASGISFANAVLDVAFKRVCALTTSAEEADLFNKWLSNRLAAHPETPTRPRDAWEARAALANYGAGYRAIHQVLIDPNTGNWIDIEASTMSRHKAFGMTVRTVYSGPVTQPDALAGSNEKDVGPVDLIAAVPLTRQI